MNPAELIFSLVLIVVLLLLAGYFGWRQFQTLRSLRQAPGPSPEDRSYLRRQAVRRLVCCTLMVVLAGLLSGSLAIEPGYQKLRRELEPPRDAAVVPQEHKDFARFYAAYWIATLLVVFALIGLAGVDFWAIARYGARHRRQLKADHRAELHEEVARIRRQRNGESGA